MDKFVIRDKSGNPYQVEANTFDDACAKLNLDAFDCTGERLKEDAKTPETAWEKCVPPERPANYKAPATESPATPEKARKVVKAKEPVIESSGDYSIPCVITISVKELQRLGLRS